MSDADNLNSVTVEIPNHNFFRIFFAFRNDAKAKWFISKVIVRIILSTNFTWMIWHVVWLISVRSTTNVLMQNYSDQLFSHLYLVFFFFYFVCLIRTLILRANRLYQRVDFFIMWCAFDVFTYFRCYSQLCYEPTENMR